MNENWLIEGIKQVKDKSWARSKVIFSAFCPQRTLRKAKNAKELKS